MQHLNKTRNEQWFDLTSEVHDDEQVEDTLKQVEDTLNSSQVNLDDSNQVNIEKKKPKWETKLLQDVKSDEKGKIGTRSSNIGSKFFSLSVVEPAAFNEAIEYDEGKIAMLSEYGAVIKNQTWKIVDCPHDVKPYWL